jgi:coproporphyrinogen III oxidase-like Fe-S oxidoreductase
VPDGPAQQEGFVEAALVELRRARAELGGRPASTGFFGGGTPTLLGAEALVRLLAEIEATFGLPGAAEVTTEANPECGRPGVVGVRPGARPTAR